MATVIDAIQNLVHNPRVLLAQAYKTHNRANYMGEALEEYVKDLFAGSFNVTSFERMEAHAQTFSYLGNNSNPPDAMLRNGDAIEVKKTESLDAQLALNSSYPKHKLRADCSMISEPVEMQKTGKRKIFSMLLEMFSMDTCDTLQWFTDLTTVHQILAIKD